MRCVLPSVGSVLLSSALLLCPLSIPCASAAVLRVKPDAPEPADGASWATAFPTVQEALRAAASGDDVWVAAGTYQGTASNRIVLTSAVSLLGGFAGTETAASQRDPNSRTTTLTVTPLSGSVVEVQASGAVVDGFRISGGHAAVGGGVYCIPDVSAVISNNMITGNTAGKGGGVYCQAETKVFNNTIVDNEASNGAGIMCAQGAQTVSGNTITGNDAGKTGYGGGIELDQSDAIVVNNIFRKNIARYGAALYESTGTPATSGAFLIADNVMAANRGFTTVTLDGQAGGNFVNNTVVCSESTPDNNLHAAVSISNASPPPVMANNLIAFNAGIGLELNVTLVAGQMVVRNNDLFGNKPDVDGPDTATENAVQGAAGNFSADPRLAPDPDGIPHLQPDSPCVDAGDDTVVQPGDTDRDGQPRIQSAHVDIGADESEGTAWPWHLGVIRVNGATGDDANDGSAWNRAYKTLKPALLAAAENSAEVWLAKGTYACDMVRQPYGVAVYGGFAGSETRRDQRSADPALTVLDGGETGTVVTIVTGSPDTTILDGLTITKGVIGIEADAGAPSISNVVVRDNAGEGIVMDGGSPWVSHVEVRGNRQGGIRMHLSQGQITDCLIAGNHRDTFGGGIYGEGVQGLIARNRITGNDAGYGGAMSFSNAQTRVVDNLIAGNIGTGAVTFEGKAPNTPFFANNTVVDNPAGGTITHDASDPTVLNNIIAFNGRNGIATIRAAGTYQRNIVWQNTAGDFSGFTPDETNVQKDPLFADRLNGNYHLSAGSPAIDVGDDTAVLPDDTDLDGLPRLLGPHVDLGAFELPPSGFRTMADVLLALKAAGGLLAPDAATVTRLKVVGSGGVDLRDAVAIAREAIGLDANP